MLLFLCMQLTWPCCMCCVRWKGCDQLVGSRALRGWRRIACAVHLGRAGGGQCVWARLGAAAQSLAGVFLMIASSAGIGVKLWLRGWCLHFSTQNFNFLIAVLAAVLLTINCKLCFVTLNHVKGCFDPQWQLSRLHEMEEMGQLLGKRWAKEQEGPEGSVLPHRRWGIYTHKDISLQVPELNQFCSWLWWLLCEVPRQLQAGSRVP